MSRVMQRDGYDDVTVIEWVLLKNSWEVFVIEKNKKTIFSLTCGFEDEFGSSMTKDVYDNAMMVAKGDELGDVMPPANWKWVE